jgi:1,2-diacylglycerol 3-alpha-glucosyltransferase
MLTGGKNKQVAILFHRVGPYHFARLRAAGKVLAATLIEIFKDDEVYGWSPVPGADGFERLTLFEKHPQPARAMMASIQIALDRCQPTAVVIPGWSDAVAFSAVQWCIARQIPVIVMSESTEWDEPRRFWKEWIKRRLLKMCASGFVGGQPHVEYLARLGMPDERIFQGYDAVDNDYFAVKAAEARSQKPEARSRHGLPENFFLASARFVEKKNLPLLIRAYARYRELAGKSEIQNQKSEPWDLVLLGDGPLKSDLCRLIAELGLQESVRLPGFKQYDELPAYYGLAKVFIHASTTEQWGLVVNEAMASELPVLISNRCGCAQDLVQEGGNGFTFDPHNAEQLAGLMFRLSRPDFDLAKMGQSSGKIISQWSPERFAAGMVRAVEAALVAPRPRPTVPDRLFLKLLLMS